MSKELIKASPAQRDPQFIELLNDGQSQYKRYINDAKTNTNLSDIEIVARYIKECDIVISVFKDDEYELGWGFYFIKRRVSSVRIMNAEKADRFAIGVIPCRMLEEAVVFSQNYGDIKNSN
jgi:hypothetical protein